MEIAAEQAHFGWRGREAVDQQDAGSAAFEKYGSRIRVIHQVRGWYLLVLVVV